MASAFPEPHELELRLRQRGILAAPNAKRLPEAESFYANAYADLLRPWDTGAEGIKQPTAEIRRTGSSLRVLAEELREDRP